MSSADADVRMLVNDRANCPRRRRNDKSASSSHGSSKLRDDDDDEDDGGNDDITASPLSRRSHGTPHKSRRRLLAPR